jgi:hypothetical protein
MNSKPSNNEQQVDEAMPMGVFKRAGNKLLSKLPTFAPNKAGAAQGRLETGKLANKIMPAYKRHLGQIGEEPTPENIIKFLRLAGLPTTKASSVLSSLTAEPASPAASVGADAPAPTPAPAPAPAPTTATESVRNILNKLNEVESAPKLSEKQIAQVFLAAAQEHASLKADAEAQRAFSGNRTAPAPAPSPAPASGSAPAPSPAPASGSAPAPSPAPASGSAPAPSPAPASGSAPAARTPYQKIMDMVNVMNETELEQLLKDIDKVLQGKKNYYVESKIRRRNR